MSQQKEIPLAFISNRVSKKKKKPGRKLSSSLKIYKKCDLNSFWYFFLPLLSVRSHWSCFGNKGPISFQSVCRNSLLIFLYLMEIQTWDFGRFELEAQWLTFFIAQSCKLPLPSWRQDSSGRPHIGNWWTPSKSYLTTLTGRSSQPFGRGGESQSSGRMLAILNRGLSVWSLHVSAWIWRRKSSLWEAQ